MRANFLIIPRLIRLVFLLRKKAYEKIKAGSEIELLTLVSMTGLKILPPAEPAAIFI